MTNNFYPIFRSPDLHFFIFLFIKFLLENFFLFKRRLIVIPLRCSLLIDLGRGTYQSIRNFIRNSFHSSFRLCKSHIFEIIRQKLNWGTHYSQLGGLPVLIQSTFRLVQSIGKHFRSIFEKIVKIFQKTCWECFWKIYEIFLDTIVKIQPDFEKVKKFCVTFGNI